MRARIAAIAVLSAASLGLLAACSSSSHDASSDGSAAASSPAAAASLVAAASSPAAAASSPVAAASSPAAAASSPADSSSSDVATELVTAADLGDGWAVDPSPGSASNAPSCFKSAAAPLKATAHAEANLLKGGGDPVLDELVANFPDAAGTYASTVAIFDACKQVTVTTNGVASTGNLDPAASPNVGDKSSAYSLSLVAEGTTVGYDLAVIQQGNALALVLYAHAGTPDAQEFQTVASAIAAKLPKSS